MDRRSLLRLASAAGAAAVMAGAATGRTGTYLEHWPEWRDRFLTREGRVVDPEQGGVSHSEGQAYGLLLAQAAGDRDAFERIEAWTRAHLMIRDDALMAWRWTPGGGVRGDDWQNATDGDLFRAWALLRARRDSGWPVDGAQLAAIVSDLSVSCLWPDPRSPADLLLRPSAEARASASRVLLNPSYIMPRALRELGLHAGDERLVRAADHGETCLAELAAEDLLPDWIDVTATGFAAPKEHELRSAYDALRIPLYLLWSDRAGHPAVALARGRLAAGGQAPRIVVARDRSGAVVATSDLPGYLALAELVACSPVRGPLPHGPYYPATLGLLAEVAAREGAQCSAP